LEWGGAKNKFLGAAAYFTMQCAYRKMIAVMVFVRFLEGTKSKCGGSPLQPSDSGGSMLGPGGTGPPKSCLAPPNFQGNYGT